MPARGEIYWQNLGHPDGSEPGFRRPVVVVQDDRLNRSAISTCIVAAITTNLDLARLPGNVFLAASDSGLNRDSAINLTQLVAIDKSTLGALAGSVPRYLLADIDAGLRLVLGLVTPAR